MEHRIPPLRRHKRKGRKDQAYVSFDGKRTYFGGWGTPAVNAAYKQFVAQWEVDLSLLKTPPTQCQKDLGHRGRKPADAKFPEQAVNSNYVELTIDNVKIARERKQSHASRGKLTVCRAGESRSETSVISENVTDSWAGRARADWFFDSTRKEATDRPRRELAEGSCPLSTPPERGRSTSSRWQLGVVVSPYVVGRTRLLVGTGDSGKLVGLLLGKPEEEEKKEGDTFSKLIAPAGQRDGGLVVRVVVERIAHWLVEPTRDRIVALRVDSDFVRVPPRSPRS